MSKLLISFVILFSFSAQAVEMVGAQGFKRFKGAACPVIPAEYEEALVSIEKFTQVVIKESGCEAVNKEIQGLSVLKSDHGKFLDIVLGKTGKKLEAADALKVQKYAQNAATLISGVLTALKSPSCPIEETRAQRKQIQKTMTDLAYGIVSGVSRVAGPYGTPIIIGANVLKGVVFGLQAMQEDRNGYNFDQSLEGEEEVKAYAKTLCVFSNLRLEYEYMVQPKQYYNNLLQIKSTLTQSVDKLTSECPECGGLMGIDLDMSGLDILKAVGPDIKGQINREQKQKRTAATLESMAWVDQQINRIEGEQQGLRGLGPALLMEKITRLEEFLIDTEAEPFLEWIFEKSRVNFNKFVRNSQNRFEGYTSRYMRLSFKPVPSLMKMVVNPMKWPYYTGVVKYNLDRDFAPLYGFYDYLMNGNHSFKSNPGEQDNVESYYQKSIREMLGFEHYVSALEEYCSFFKRSNLYSPVRKICSNEKLKFMGKAFEKEYYADPANAQLFPEPNYFNSWDEALEVDLKAEQEFINQLN